MVRVCVHIILGTSYQKGEIEPMSSWKSVFMAPERKTFAKRILPRCTVGTNSGTPRLKHYPRRSKPKACSLHCRLLVAIFTFLPCLKGFITFLVINLNAVLSVTFPLPLNCIPTVLERLYEISLIFKIDIHDLIEMQ